MVQCNDLEITQNPNVTWQTHVNINRGIIFDQLNRNLVTNILTRVRQAYRGNPKFIFHRYPSTLNHAPPYDYSDIQVFKRLFFEYLRNIVTTMATRDDLDTAKLTYLAVVGEMHQSFLQERCTIAKRLVGIYDSSGVDVVTLVNRGQQLTKAIKVINVALDSTFEDSLAL